MVTGETQTASVHCKDNHLKHLNLIAVEREEQTKRDYTVQQADKETVLGGISERAGGMF